MFYPPPPPRPILTTYIQRDSNAVRPGIILTAKCSVGYPPYSYVWIAFGDTNYYIKLLVFLNQHCVIND